MLSIIVLIVLSMSNAISKEVKLDDAQRKSLHQKRLHDLYFEDEVDPHERYFAKVKRKKNQLLKHKQLYDYLHEVREANMRNIRRPTAAITHAYPNAFKYAYPKDYATYEESNTSWTTPYERCPYECMFVKSSNRTSRSLVKYYYVLSCMKMEILGDQTLSLLDLFKEDAIVVDDEELESIQNDEPLNGAHEANKRRFILLYHLVRNCHLQPPFYKPSNILKTLIVMVDNRELQETSIEKSKYLTLNAFVNYKYAQRNGYDFLVVNVNSTNLKEDVEARFGSRRKETIDQRKATSSQQANKDMATTFNFITNGYRESPWAKIPVLMYILEMLAMETIDGKYEYDVILFIDSDACFNPSLHYRTVSDFFNFWNHHHHLVFVGNQIRSASIIMPSDYPLETLENEPLPCTGIMWLKVHQNHRKLQETLQLWWNTDVTTPLPHNYEQTALHNILYARNLSQFVQLNPEIALIHGEHQWFLQYDWKPIIKLCDNQFICHAMHLYSAEATSITRAWIKELMKFNDSSYLSTVLEIKLKNTMYLPSLKLTEFISMNINASTKRNLLPSMVKLWKSFKRKSR
jgi:hypothetical protein